MDYVRVAAIWGASMLVLLAIISTWEGFKRSEGGGAPGWGAKAMWYSFGVGFFVALGFYWWRVHMP